MTVWPGGVDSSEGKRTLSEAKVEAGWGEGATQGKRQGQTTSLPSGQEQWSTAQVNLGWFLGVC